MLDCDVQLVLFVCLFVGWLACWLVGLFVVYICSFVCLLVGWPCLFVCISLLFVCLFVCS